MRQPSLARALMSLLSFARVEFGARQVCAGEIDQAEFYTREIGFAQVGRNQVGSVKCDAMLNSMRLRSGSLKSA